MRPGFLKVLELLLLRSHRSLDRDGQRGGDVSVKLDFNVALTRGLDGFIEEDRVAIDHDAFGL